MKKSLIVTLMILLICLIAAGSTLTWLFDTAEATNTFTVGKIDIELNEPAWSSSEVIKKLYPGAEIEKDPVVTVKSNSENCYVYVMIDNQLNDTVSDAVTMDIDSTHWIHVQTSGSKSLYRYFEIVNNNASDQKLEKVFTKVTVDTANVTESNISELDGKTILVKAYAHQSEATSGIDLNAKAATYFSMP